MTLRIFLILLGILLANAAFADKVTVVTSVGDATSPTTSSVRGNNWNPGDSGATINVTCYYAATATQRCAGGGIFDSPAAAPPCSDADNGATVLQDSVGHCFYRRNFGLNGIADARQCGVVGDGNDAGYILPGGEIHPYDGDRLVVCSGLASNAGVFVVTTGGGVILDNTTDIGVPDNVTLTCGGTSVTGAGGNDYRISSAGGSLSKAIVLNPTTAGSPAGPFTIRLTGRNSALEGCTVEAGGGIKPEGGEYPNPYSPSLWFPNCQPDIMPCTPDTPSQHTYLRSSILEASAFNPNPTAQYPGPCTNCGPASQSVGITIDGGNHATIRDVAILGFGTCLKARAAAMLTIEDCAGDCATGLDIQTPDAPFISNLRIGHFLTDPERS